MATKLPPGVVSRIANHLVASSKEVARALPSSKGGETDLQLQTARTEAYTYFTVPGPTALLYSAENWVKIKLTLETAGPVSVGQRAALTPVLGGKGRLLDTSVEYETTIARGTRFYIAAETINRVSVTIEPIPWLEQIDADGRSNAASIREAIGGAAAGIINAILGLKSGAATTSTGGRTTDEVLRAPSIPQGRGLMPRLTSITRRSR